MEDVEFFPSQGARTPGAPASSRPCPKEWFHRGYLPHVDHPDFVQLITFRLADSLPWDVLERWTIELAHLPNQEQQTERERRIREWLDQGHGACWLRGERIATVVEDALLHFDGQRYRLLAWCVMPNHVHVVIETFREQSLSHTVHSWKSFTATQANRILGRTGVFWQREYHDRFMRNDEHLRQTVEYVEYNPVKAGLVRQAEDWRFSSARYRGKEESEG